MSVIKLVSKQDDGFVFDVEALREKLAIYADHKIAVISIAGAFRTGKSFLANWIIRYFEIDRDENWLDSQGFTKQYGPYSVVKTRGPFFSIACQIATLVHFQMV